MHLCAYRNAKEYVGCGSHDAELYLHLDQQFCFDSSGSFTLVPFSTLATQGIYFINKYDGGRTLTRHLEQTRN